MEGKFLPFFPSSLPSLLPITKSVKRFMKHANRRMEDWEVAFPHPSSFPSFQSSDVSPSPCLQIRFQVFITLLLSRAIVFTPFIFAAPHAIVACRFETADGFCKVDFSLAERLAAVVAA